MLQQLFYLMLTAFFVAVIGLPDAQAFGHQPFAQENCFSTPHQVHPSTTENTRPLEYSATKPLGQPSGRTSQHEFSFGEIPLTEIEEIAVNPVQFGFSVQYILRLFYAVCTLSLGFVLFHIDQAQFPLRQIYLTFHNLRI